MEYLTADKDTDLPPKTDPVVMLGFGSQTVD